MGKLETLKEQLQSAKDDLTRATAVMGEVKSNIGVEIQALADLGVEIPAQNDMTEAEWYQAILAKAADHVDALQKNIEEKTQEIEDVFKKWSE